MRYRRAFRELVETPFGSRLKRYIDEIHLLAGSGVWKQEKRNLALEQQCQFWELSWPEIERRTKKAGGNPRLSRFFLDRLDEQISRAELIEAARLR